MRLAVIAPAVDGRACSDALEYLTETNSWVNATNEEDLRFRRATWGLVVAQAAGTPSIYEVGNLTATLRGAYEGLAKTVTRGKDLSKYENLWSDYYPCKPLPEGGWPHTLLAYDPETGCARAWVGDAWFSIEENRWSKKDWHLHGECDGWEIYSYAKFAFVNFESDLRNYIHMTLLQLCSWDTPAYAYMAALRAKPVGAERTND